MLTTGQVRLALVPLRRIHLHTAGEPDADSAAVEYMAPLHLPGHSEAVHAALGALVQARTWDEFVLDGVAEEALEALLRAIPGVTPETEWRPTMLSSISRGSAARV